MTTPNTVAVVIPYYQHEEFIDATLESVAQQTEPVERVILVERRLTNPVPLRRCLMAP